MRVLVVGAGASFSIKDVETGYFQAFKALDLKTSLYLLDKRIPIAMKWNNFLWSHLYKSDPNQKPNWDNAIYRAGVEALEMALHNEVDWVFVVSAMYLHPNVLVMMRRAHLKVAIFFTESPYDDLQQANVASQGNICFTTERTSVPYLRQFCPETYYIQHAYDPLRHNTEPTPTGPPTTSTYFTHSKEPQIDPDVTKNTHDVVFVGTGFQERIDLLTAVDWAKLGIDLGLYGAWSLLPARHRLRKYIYGNLLNNQQAHALYKNSKVGLNLYRTSKDYTKHPEKVGNAESINPRAFELAASGTFTLTDYRKEGEEIFGGSQPTFNTPQELETLLTYYLQNNRARQQCIQEALSLVEGHTFDTRARQVLAYLSNYVGKD